MSIARGVPTMRVRSGTVPPVGPARRRGREAHDGPVRSTAACDLPRPRQVGVVAHPAPLAGAARHMPPAPPAIDELLEAVLVVELRVALPGRLERFREPLG